MCALPPCCARRAVISAYFDEKGLVRQQLDSFNDFINTSLQVRHCNASCLVGVSAAHAARWLQRSSSLMGTHCCRSSIVLSTAFLPSVFSDYMPELSCASTQMCLPLPQEIVDEGKLITVKPQAQHVPGVAVDDDVEKTYEVCRCPGSLVAAILAMAACIVYLFSIQGQPKSRLAVARLHAASSSAGACPLCSTSSHCQPPAD